MTKLFLDDERVPVGDGWIVARSVPEAVEMVRRHGFPDHVSFDNDLGDGELEGRCFAEWLIRRDLDCGDMPDAFSFYVHSQNPVARDAINGKLNAYLKFRSVGQGG